MRRIPRALIASVWLVATAAGPLPVTAPIAFSGDTLQARKADGWLRLDGNASVVHAETTIEADRIEIRYAADGKTIERMIARGHVRMHEPNRRGRADAAVYEPPTRRLTMTGRPWIWDGGDELTGDRIIVFKDPDRVVVERARALVQPERVRAATATPAESP